MALIEEINSLVTSDKDVKERKKELNKLKKKEEKTENQTKKAKKEDKKEPLNKKSLMQKLREELDDVKGKELEKKDISGLIIEEKEPEHLWLKKEKGTEKTEDSKKHKTLFREGHWHKTEKQKKENKVSELNLKIEEKNLHPEEPEEKTQIIEMLKKTASDYKKINKLPSIPEKKIMKKGVSEKVLIEKKVPVKTKPFVEDELIQGLLLETPKKRKKVEEPKPKEKNIVFQEIEEQEEEKPKNFFPAEPQRMKELEGIIPSKNKKQKEETKEENFTIAQQLGNITGFFTKGIVKKMGVKQVNKNAFEGLTKEEQKKIKKLASSLEVSVKKYTKEEIIEAMELEGHTEKIIKAVISLLYD